MCQIDRRCNGGGDCDPSHRDNWHCAKCGQPSGSMQGHYRGDKDGKSVFSCQKPKEENHG
jgi:hypothetical protein